MDMTKAQAAVDRLLRNERYGDTAPIITEIREYGAGLLISYTYTIKGSGGARTLTYNNLWWEPNDPGKHHAWGQMCGITHS